jgi:hypothetical protein
MNEGKLTKGQYRTLKSNLAELPELQSGAASFISPSRSGSGSGGGVCGTNKGNA